MASKRSLHDISIRGPAHLAYIALDDGEENHAFQGHVVDSATKQCYGFMATQVERKNPLDCCCQADDPPLWFKLTLIDYQNKKETDRVVIKTGGDYLTLSSPNISFQTNQLLTGPQAERHMRKYNPKLLQYADALVCVGDMTINDLDFEESCDEDNLVCSHHHEEVSQKAPEKRKKQEKEENQQSQATNGTSHAKEIPDDGKVEMGKQDGKGENTERTRKGDSRGEEVDDDDFGFEEYQDVKLIKVGLKDEENKEEQEKGE